MKVRIQHRRNDSEHITLYVDDDGIDFVLPGYGSGHEVEMSWGEIIDLVEGRIQNKAEAQLEANQYGS